MSIIVPVYNVEKYVARCLDSILAQTYTNLEILIIDDGSTDSSGKICDDYAKKDSRIRVIHQENQGRAEVRNIGLREAKGEYIQSVDSDDWIDPETIETCYKYSQEYEADMVCFRAVYEFENGKSYQASDHYSPILMDSSKALSLILFAKFVNVSPCYKFAKKKCFNGVVYPKGKNYEDSYVMHFIVANAEKVLCTDHRFYHYLQHSTSIMHSSFSESTLDLDEAIQDCFEFAMSHNEGNEEARKNLLAGMYSRKMPVVNAMIKSEAASEYTEYITKLRHEINPLIVITCPHLDIKEKIKLLLFKFSFRLYKAAYMRFRRFK